MNSLQSPTPFVIRKEQWIPRSVHHVFAFFCDAGNLETMTPRWLRFNILTPRPIRMAAGARIDYRLSWIGIPLRWETEITRWNPPHEFVDVQRSGPYRLWRHSHRFEPWFGGTLMSDTVEYALPLAWMGRVVHRLVVRRDLERVFAFRAARIQERFR